MPGKFVKARLARAAAAAAVPVFTFFTVDVDAQTFTVTSNADTNTSGTLPYAINQANSYGGAATINFNSSLGTIQLTSALPALDNANGITLNGNGVAVSGAAGTDASVIFPGNGPPVVSGATPGSTAFTVSAGNLTLLAGTSTTGGNGGNDNAAAGALGASENLSGGTGVDFGSSGTLSNSGSIAGGTGGYGGPTVAGDGGTGIVATVANASVQNTGTVAGGSGGQALSSAGNGGAGMQFNAFGFVINSGTVSGGDGAQADGVPGNGGTAINFSAGGSLNNSGTITGGSGNSATYGESGGNGGNAVSFSGGGSVINSGTITGGAAGGASDETPAGSAGAALSITGGAGTFTNVNHAVINGDVDLDNYANNVTLQIGSTISGNLNVGTSTLSTLTLTDNGTGGIGTYSAAVGSTQFSGQLIKSGGGEWVMDQTLGYLGGTVLNAGTLSVSQDANLGDPSGTLTFNGGVLQITGTAFTSTARTVNWGSSGGGFDIADPGNTFTLTQTISNGTNVGTLFKTGAGTLVLAGNADNSGLGATVDAGTLVLAKASSTSPDVHAIGGGGLLINGGAVQLSGTGGDQIWDGATVTLNSGTLDVNGLAETIGTFTGSGGTVINNGSAGGTLTVSSGGSFAGALSEGSGSLTLIKTGGNTLTLAGSVDNHALGVIVNAGTLVLDKTSSYSPIVSTVGGAGLVINGGTVQLSGTGGNQIYDQAPVSLGGGTFDLNGTSETIGALSGSGGTITNNGSAAGTLTVSGGGSFGGAITNGSSRLALVKSGGNTFVLAGTTLTYSGGTSVTAGTLQVGDGSHMVSLSGANGTSVTGGFNATPPTPGAAGVNVSDGATVVVAASARVAGGSGGTTMLDNGTSATGGLGISFAATGSLTNSGAIQGGGGGQELNGNGASGAAAVNFASSGTLLNSGGVLSGGSGGLGDQGNGGNGSAAVTFAADGTLTNNAGTISGGNGANGSGGTNGTGGAGVAVTGVADFQNNGGAIRAGSGIGGGGNGISFGSAATLTNSGIIAGGSAGSGFGKNGGIGVSFAAVGTLDNTGTINGGGGSDFGGFNGAGVNFADGGSLTNSGTITPGTASYSSAAPAAVAFSGGVGTFTNLNHGVINGNVTLGNYANSIALQIGSSITGNLNIGTSTLSTLTLTDNGTGGIGTYSAAVGSTQFSGQLIKSGGGEWVMDQTLGYVGGTVLNAGILSVSKDANLGDPSGTLTFNGGVLQITGTSFTSTARTITLGSSGGGFDINNAANTFTVAQTLAGYGGLIKLGAGTLVLTAQNTFTGGTTVNAGMLVVGDGTDPAALAGLPFYLTPFQATGNVGVLVNAGGSLQVMANASITASGGGDHGGTGGAGVSFTSSGSLTNRGTITGGMGGVGADSPSGNGGAGVSFANGGSLTNSGSISGGSIGVDQDLGSGSTGPGVVFTGAAGTLINQYGGSISNGVSMGNYANAVTLQIGSSITGGLNVGTSSLSTLTLTDNGSGGTQNYSAAVDSTTFNGSLIKNGSGTWVLDQAMNYPGGTTINAGTLQVSGSGSGTTTMGSGPVAINAGGTLVGTNQDAFGYAGFAAPGTITINGGTVTDLGTSNYRVTLPNLIFTGGTLTSAAGNAGDQYGNFSLYGNGVSASVTTNASATTATISAASIAVELPTTFTVAAGSTPSGVDLIVSSNLNGSFSHFGSFGITKAGPGTMELTAANTYSGGTTVSAGTLAISGSIASSTVTVGGSSNFAALKLMSATALSSGAALIVDTAESPTIVLDFNGNQTVSTWQIDGTYVQPGIYSTSNEPAGDSGLLTMDLNYDGTLTVAVPEPSLAGAGMLTLAGLLARRQRRSSR